MRGPGRAFMVAAVLSLFAGLALVVVARQHEALAMQGSPEGCVFDQSCDITPGVVAARRVLRVAWSVVGGGAVLVGLALARASGWRYQIWMATGGLALLVIGIAARAALLGDNVPPPTLGCQAGRTCAADPGWEPRTPFYDLVWLLPLLGSAILAACILLLLGPGRLLPARAAQPRDREYR